MVFCSPYFAPGLQTRDPCEKCFLIPIDLLKQKVVSDADGSAPFIDRWMKLGPDPFRRGTAQKEKTPSRDVSFVLAHGKPSRNEKLRGFLLSQI